MRIVSDVARFEKEIKRIDKQRERKYGMRILKNEEILRKEICRIDSVLDTKPIPKELREEVSLAAKELLDKFSRPRKSTVSLMSDGLYCIRVEKYWPNEQIAFIQKGIIDFKIGETVYRGRVKSTASFKDEFIAVIEIPKKEVQDVTR